MSLILKQHRNQLYQKLKSLRRTSERGDKEFPRSIFDEKVRHTSECAIRVEKGGIKTRQMRKERYLYIWLPTSWSERRPRYRLKLSTNHPYVVGRSKWLQCPRIPLQLHTCHLHVAGFLQSEFGCKFRRIIVSYNALLRKRHM